ncbi:hypothetical protein B0H13DRAFT_2327564 [Mycena leptocephala]|nr:hypothetical protein B0H13DRAFT_2327564 [Mycena leptocephala]
MHIDMYTFRKENWIILGRRAPPNPQVPHLHPSARAPTQVSLHHSVLSMNYHEYATAITDELRSWVHAWLAGVHASWTLHAALRLPLPYPNYPLPPTFPFGAFSVWRIFE